MSDLPVDAIRQMLRELRRVTTVFRLYGADHPETRNAADVLDGLLEPLLGDVGRLDLDVDSEHLRVGDVTVYEDDSSSSLAEALYMEGIQRLSLLPGVEPDEVLELIRLLSLNLNLPGYEEETLISLLWQADLPHVQYLAVEGLVEAVEQSESAASGEMGVFGDVLTYVLSTRADALDDLPAIAIPGGEELAADLGDPVLSTLDGTYAAHEGEDGEWVVEVEDEESADAASIEIVVPGSGDPEDMPEHHRPDRAPEPRPFEQEVLRAAQAAGLHEPLDWDRQRQSATVDVLRWAEGQHEELGVAPEKLAAYWESVESDSYETMLRQVLEVLLFLVAHPHPALQEDEVDELSRQAMRSVLDHRLLTVYLATLRLLELLIEEGEFAEREQQLVALRDRWTGPEVMADVCRMMPAEGPQSEEIVELIEHGGVRRAVVVRDLLSSVQGPRRERLMEAVVRAAGHDPAPLGEELGHLRPEQLTVALTCMARIDHPSMRRPIERSLRHPAAEVRMHALSLLDDADRAESYARIVPLIRDRDGEVRMAALQALKGITTPELMRELQPELAPARFKARPSQEQQLLAICFARAGGPRAIPALRGLLEQGRLSLMSAAERTDLEAAMWGLVAIGTPEARQIVKQSARSMLPGLRQAARQVLEQLGLDRD